MKQLLMKHKKTWLLKSHFLQTNIMKAPQTYNWKRL